METTHFNTLYSRLNAKQKEAVDTIEGPVMVIAGPGTGKTSILTLRIANILKKTDTKAENILALTFTESGVQSMRSKLIDIMGPEAYKVNIFTFHGFANYIIKRYPDEFPRIISSDNASEVDKVQIIESILDDQKREKAFEYIKPYGDTYYYVPSLIDSIKHLKREYISVEDFVEVIERQKQEYAEIPDLIYDTGAHKGKIKGKYKDIEKNIKKNEELLQVYKMYEYELTARKLYDFEDMLLEFIKAMRKSSDLLLSLQEQYQYILADEHQDANNAQNTILELLANFHSNPNLFIVGDEKQAVFRFQGASLENFLYFKNLYSEVTLITLENNYRSSQSILDASHELIGHNVSSTSAHDPALRIKLTSQRLSEERPIDAVECVTEDDERAYIIGEIKTLLSEGVPAKEIAVLFRKNREADAIIRACSQAGIPYAIFSDRDMFKDHNVRKLLLVLEAINDPSNETILSEISFFDIFNLPLTSLFEAFKKTRHDSQSLITQFIKDPILKPFVEKVLHLSSVAKNEDLITFFETFLSETEWGVNLVKGRHPLGNIASFEAFLNEVKKYAELDRSKGLKDFLSYLQTVQTYNIRIGASSNNGGNEDSVSLMTAHKSKGLEFEYVFIIGATDKTWGNTRDSKKFTLPHMSPSMIEDDRKLFYVALTRAKQKITITYSTQGLDGKPQLPSQFLLEMKENLLHKKQFHVEKVEDNTSTISQAFLPFKESLLDKTYLRNLFLNESFSVTALNNFLSCPWKYFFNNLIRLPQLQTKHQLYGIAIHDTLKYLFLSLSRGEQVTKSDMLFNFINHLEQKPLSKMDFEESVAKGKNALDGYYERYKQMWKTEVLCEHVVSGIPMNIPGLDQAIHLRGIIDKIELSKPDVHEPQYVHVVDYKTAKPKSRNEIEGKTKNATGDYKRQLIFYKFLLDNDVENNQNKYTVVSGEIDFIEPDEKGNYRKEVFDISDADVGEMKECIQNTLKEIYEFEFFDKGCNEEECEMCKLSQLIRI